MRKLLAFFVCAAAGFLAGQTKAAPAAATDRCAFVTVTNISRFAETFGTTAHGTEAILISPEIAAPINWDELVASWNVVPGVYLKLEARAIFPDHTTKYFTLDEWSDDTAKHPRQSVNRQRDADGTVSTDTLILNRHGGKVQLRLTMGGPKGSDLSQIKFLGLSFCDSKTAAAPRPANHAAWGKTIEVPERRQGEYAGGGGWCSPTSLSMVLAYWGENQHRPELNHTVPDVAHAIDDANLGTGNWPFNTAYAGSFPGLRAYVTRLDDVSELEDWIAAGITPIVSVSSFILPNHQGRDDGHLIVCVGFTGDGDIVVNDPGVSVKRNVRARQVYTRQHFIDCWKKSKNAVYLIYPVDAAIPKNVSGHWADN